jgi:hypothetical protein
LVILFFGVIFRIPIDRISWTTSSFLIGTFLLTLTAVPVYLWYFGVDWFQVAVFALLLTATRFSSTLAQPRRFPGRLHAQACVALRRLRPAFARRLRPSTQNANASWERRRITPGP